MSIQAILDKYRYPSEASDDPTARHLLEELNALLGQAPPELAKELDALAPLAAAATEGPWEINRQYEQVWSPGTRDFVNTCDSPHDSAFIAAARNFLTPANIAALRATAAPVVGSGPDMRFLTPIRESRPRLHEQVWLFGPKVGAILGHLDAGEEEEFWEVGQEEGLDYDEITHWQLSPSPVATEGAGQPTNDELRKKLARAEQALLDCGEAVGRYEGSGDLVYDNDDYVTDGEGCYLTREEARVLTEDKLPAAPQPQKGGQPNA